MDLNHEVHGARPLRAEAAADTWPADTWPSGDVPRHGWLPEELDLAALTHALEPAEIAALWKLVDRCKAKGLGYSDVDMNAFSDPLTDGILARLARQLRFGPGLVFLKNIPIDERPLDDLRMLYWGIGTHFGKAVSQNPRGDLVGEVRVREDIVTTRGYANPGRLPVHTDRVDMLSLLSVRKAASGGSNIFVSGLKLWDIVAEERPDLLPVLKAGFPQYHGNERAKTEAIVTPYRIPLFAEVNGLRSCQFSGNAMLNQVSKNVPESLGEHGAEALAYVTSVADREELHLHVMLEPGEAVFINNHEVMHSRAAFVDHTVMEERRFLLRLWIEGRPWRPKPAEMVINQNPSGRQGIDPVEVEEAA